MSDDKVVGELGQPGPQTRPRACQALGLQSHSTFSMPFSGKVIMPALEETEEVQGSPLLELSPDPGHFCKVLLLLRMAVAFERCSGAEHVVFVLVFSLHKPPEAFSPS